MPKFSAKKPFQQEIYSRHVGEIKALLHALELRDSVIEGENRPPMDMYESEAAFILEFDLPGFELSDISITIQGATLLLDGRRSCGNEEKNRRFICLERGHGIFHHAVTMPGNFKAEAVSAEYRRGVLRVTCPKQVEQKVSIKEIVD